MPDIKQVLNDEIRRLARKEVKNALLPLQKQIADQKRAISELKKQLADAVKKMPVAEVKVAKTAVAPDGDPKKLRLTAEGIIRLRTKKLSISQSKLAEMVGVSGHTVSLWEIGKVAPRASAKAALCALRTIGKKELKRRLAELQSAAADETK